MKSSKLLLIAAITCFAQIFGTALAQQYPDKPVRVVIVFSAGTAGDQLGRIIGQKVSASIGQQVVADNRAGASGLIGTMAVARSPNDGYTLLLINDSFVINPSLQLKPAYDPLKDFAPITVAANIPYALSVHPSLPVRTIKELVALAKTRPGLIDYGSGAIPQRLAMEMFAKQMQIKLNHVGYRGTGPAFTDVLGGQIPMMFAGVTNAVPYVASGRVRVLAVSSSQRSSALPQVPTMAEAGVPGFHYAVWLGFLAPAGTSAEIINKLHTEIERAMAAPDVRKAYEQFGFQHAGGSPADFTALLRRDAVRLPALARDAGIAKE